MTARHRLTIVALAALVLVVFFGTAVASAQEEETDSGAAVEVDDGGAAVPVPPPDAEGDEQPWTSRFLPPTIVLLTVLTIGGLFAYYFFAIRGRYEVVEG